MEERRKLNKQHKYKDKRRNNATSKAPPNASKTTQPKKTTAPTTATAARKAAMHSTSSSSDSDDPYSSRQFSKRTIVRNWNKYDLNVRQDGIACANDNDDDDANNGQLSAADFGQLLSAPPAEGEHFRFSSERTWDVDDSAATAADLFGAQYLQMNVTLIERLLLAVPFYERQGYDRNIFTGDELERMHVDARKYGQSTKTKTTARSSLAEEEKADPTLLLKSKVEEPYAKQTTELQLPSTEFHVSDGRRIDDVDELDELLSMNTLKESRKQPTLATGTDTQTLVPAAASTIKKLSSTTPIPVSPANDLQQWLDDILDD